MELSATYPVLYFDGVCNLCNSTVQFIIKHDKRKQFRFAPLQSVPGKAVLQQIGGDAQDSVILQYNRKYYSKSDAVLQVMKLLGGVWKTSLIGYLLPRFFRNMVYDWIAKNRYRWFGRQDECMIPTAELRSRFLDYEL
jgi:predicted DCC family thiol-disulfide oxidoreductase YuxK